MRSLEAECSTSVQQSAAAVDEQHRRAAIEARRAFRTGGIRNCWRSELGAQSGRKNQPVWFVMGCQPSTIDIYE